MENKTLLVIGVIFFVGIIVLAVVVGIGYLWLQSNNAPAPQVEDPVTNVEEIIDEEDPAEPITEVDEEEVVPPSPTPEPMPEFTPTPEPTATPEFTSTPEPVDRCQLFDSEATVLTLHDVPLFTTDLTFFLDFGHPVPGLEEAVSGDEDEWVYSAILGSSPTEPCTFREYSGRIYCMVMDFPKGWWGTTQPLEVFVNGCEEPIFTHNRVSILKPGCESSMLQGECGWVGGKWHCTGGVCKCNCP